MKSSIQPDQSNDKELETPKTPEEERAENIKKLGELKGADPRIRFIMDTIIPEQEWAISKIEEGILVTYPEGKKGPMVKSQELMSRLSLSFGIYPQGPKHIAGMARTAMSQLVFPNPENYQQIFFV